MNIISNGTIALLIVIFIIGQLFPSPFFYAIYTTLSAIAIIISVFYSKGMPKIFGTIMIIMGSSLFLYQQQPLEVWGEAVTRNLPLVCLIVAVPVLGVPIGLGGYHHHLQGIASRFHKRPQFVYLFIAGLFSLIAPITNLGSMYIIYALLEKLELPDKLLGRVIVRGFTAVHTWSPYFASVFLVVYSLNIPIYQYIPYGLLLSFFQLFIGFSLYYFFEMKNMKLEKHYNETNTNYKKMYELFAGLFLLTGLIFAFESFSNLNVSVLITLIVFFFALIWTVYLKLSRHFFKEVNNYWKVIFPNRANEVNLLLTAGFFGIVITYTPVSGFIQNVLGGLANISVFLLIIITISFITLLSFIGIHQIVTISALVATVTYDELGINVMVLAMMLLSAWAISATVSPISPILIGTSGLIERNVFSVIHWNLLYVIVILLVHSTFIYGVHLFIFR